MVYNRSLKFLVALCHGLDSVRSGRPTGIPAQVRVRTQRDFRETSLSICRLKFSISCDICNDPLVNSVVITGIWLTVHLSSAQFNVLCLRTLGKLQASGVIILESPAPEEFFDKLHRQKNQSHNILACPRGCLSVWVIHNTTLHVGIGLQQVLESEGFNQSISSQTKHFEKIA